MKLNAVALFAALVTAKGSLAAVSITFPNSNVWWVANSINLLSWTCQDPSAPSTYTVIIYNSGNLAGGLPIIGLQKNFDCSINIAPNGDLVPGTGYQVALTNPLNRSDTIAKSDAFEIKPEGSNYPPEPSNNATTATSGPTSTGSSTSTASSSSPTTSKQGAASALSPAPLSFSAAIALMFGALFA